MRSADDIIRFIEGQPGMMATLAIARDHGPAEGWIGAGFIRDAVWDALHGRPWAASWRDGGDVDLLYFEPADLSAAAERSIESALRKAAPEIPWSVKNQARMHLRNGDAPYRDIADALFHWLETATAIAARLEGEAVVLLAPHGVEDLLGLTLRATPAGLRKPAAFQERIRAKNWLNRWPDLRLA
jgi:hypothetical protein